MRNEQPCFSCTFKNVCVQCTCLFHIQMYSEYSTAARQMLNGHGTVLKALPSPLQTPRHLCEKASTVSVSFLSL